MIGSVVLVRFPFTDLESSKKRPALVLREVRLSKIHIVQIAMITSRVDGLKFPHDIEIKGWRDAGLLHPSVVRLDKVTTIDTSIVEKRLGVLSKADRIHVGKKLVHYFGRFTGSSK